MKSAMVAACLAFLAPAALSAQDSALARPVKVVHHSPDIITLEEIEAVSDAKDAYELVRRLRPQFLYTRATGTAGRTTPVDILVWVNGAERGNLETLTTIPAHAVIEIRKISAADAVTQFGKDQNGVILVRVRTGVPPEQPIED